MWICDSPEDSAKSRGAQSSARSNRGRDPRAIPPGSRSPNTWSTLPPGSNVGLAGEPKPLRGILHVRVLAAYHLLNKDSGINGDVSDPYVIASYGGIQYATSVIEDNLNPKWDTSTFHFPVDVQAGEECKLSLEVKNHNEDYGDDSLGVLEVDLATLPPGQQKIKERLSDGGGAQLELSLWFEPEPAQSGPSQDALQIDTTNPAVAAAHKLLADLARSEREVKELQLLKRTAEESLEKAVLAEQQEGRRLAGSFSASTGVLLVRCIAGHRLQGNGIDSYVAIRYGPKQFRTDIVHGSSDPIWNSKEFRFEVARGHGSKVGFQVMNHQTFSYSYVLGKLEVDVSRLVPGRWARRREKLSGGGGGELEVRLCFQPEGDSYQARSDSMLYVHVVESMARDSREVNDHQIQLVLRCDHTTCKSSSRPGAVHMQWDESFKFPLELDTSAALPLLNVMVMREDGEEVCSRKEPLEGLQNQRVQQRHSDFHRGWHVRFKLQWIHSRPTLLREQVQELDERLRRARGVLQKHEEKLQKCVPNSPWEEPARW